MIGLKKSMQMYGFDDGKIISLYRLFKIYINLYWNIPVLILARAADDNSKRRNKTVSSQMLS